ncbi:GGDEF domain-containing phosphodiesterase [Vibrio cincinnatiensis]|uniref:GGDEF domain-containing phosphodiesterase n=1 Tax=Vibrio cincinnatiensis TaxID=675 RepID=UPI001EDFF329|nr:GGDEF domain-containing phosphodiesterase [Vibrio cincinnatiensis]MCG3728308.1 EAL domain-containing protein [Vibrio cincinnatiensis]
MLLTQGSSTKNKTPFLEYQQQRLIHIFDLFSEGIFHMGMDKNMTFYNPHFYQQFGFYRSTITYQEWLAIVHPLDRAKLEQRVEQHLGQESRVTTEYRVKREDGQYLWIQGTAVTKTDKNERFLVGCHRDISEQKKMTSFLHQAAFYDAASGMANTTKLLRDINDIKQQSTSPEATLVYIQIEDIKSYLNQYGSDVIQHILHHMNQALSALINNNSIIYRVRTDDFAILLLSPKSQEQLQALCQTIIERYAKSAQEQGHLFGDKMNIGVYPHFSLEEDAVQILNIASRTCQYAGEKSCTHIEIYSGQTQQAVDRFFFIERGLKEALYQHSLSVKFQPIIDALTGKVASFEALVRWRSQEFGEIYPDEFIPLAEKKGLITELGYQVFEQACQFISQYHTIHGVTTRVNINVSVLQLLNSNFPSNIKMMADEAGVPPQSIVLELTETVILDGNRHAISQLNTLSEMGFQLSLDDFGAGLSSIYSFFDLPLNQIKIDRTMALKILINPISEEYLGFIIKLCHSKKMAVVIEGIENAQMHEKFYQMGVDYLQGYWFSKPLSFATASRYTLLSTPPIA